jgi:hypothetical protein
MEEWVTLEWKSGETATRRCGETIQAKYGFETRPATEQEIHAELDRRQQEEIKRNLERREADRKEIEFMARQDYKDVCEIASILDIECFTPKSHPLDRLTPAEWAELRRRLTV